MTVERVYRVRCEVCNVRMGREVDEPALDRLAQKRGWRFLKWDYAGNESHVCDKCSHGMTDDELKDALLKRAES